MGKKAWAVRILAGAAMFGAGFLVRTAWDGYEDRQEALAAQEAAAAEALAQQEALAAQEEAAEEYLTADVVQVRIQDGQVQWYDGRLWHEAASVEELERSDRFYLAEAAFREFDEQLRQEKAALRRQEAAGAAEKEALSVGRKETPKPPARPQTSVAPEAQTEAPVSAPEVSAPEAGTGGTDGGGSGGGNPGGGNQNPGNQNPGSGSISGGTPVAPPPPEVPVNPGDSGDGGGDAGGDTGDGENMEWSDDYL